MSTIFRIKLHHWNIEVHTEVARYIQILRNHLSYYLIHPSKTEKAKTSEQRRICFHIFHRTGKEKGICSQLAQKKIFQLTQHGICQIINSETGQISIFINPEKNIPDNVVYHGGFLHPLFLNLLPFHATLIHASLVSKKNQAF